MPVRAGGARKQTGDLHGNAPDSSEVALLLVDVINDLEFPGGERLVRHTAALARCLTALRRRARRANVPCIYANDNFGRWRSDFTAQVEHCLSDGVRGGALARALKPTPEDYFVLKPKHSAFFQTCLGLLLEHLGVRTLLIGGISTDSCVSFTAHDAFLRGYSLIVLRDGCAAMDSRAHQTALAQMRRVLGAQVSACADVVLSRSTRQGPA
jgi:nicotinamidase-related amidase